MNVDQVRRDSHEKKHGRYDRAAWRLVRKASTHNFLIGASFVVGAFVAVVYFEQWRVMIASNELNRQNFVAAQRAFVVLGSPDGKLAELCDLDGKQFIKLYFFNAGETPARHLAIDVWVTRPDRLVTGQSPHQRHRWVSAGGQIETTGLNVSSNLSAKAEHIQYVTKDMEGLTADFLKKHEIPWADAHSGMSLDGRFEYCDIFGKYYCEKFAMHYNTDVQDFVAEVGGDWQCGEREQLPVPVNPSYVGGMTEIPPCEQPDDPDYNAEYDRYFAALMAQATARSSPSATPTR